MSNYWDNRVKQWVKSQDISDRELSDRLVKYYKRTSDELQDDIARYYAKYGTDNVLEYKELLTDIRDEPEELKRLIERTDEFMTKYPEYAHLTDVRESIYKLNRLESLNYSTQLRLMELGAIEQREIEEHLKRTYGSMYKQVAKELGLGNAFLSANAQVVQHTIFDKWVDDKNFSDRIWSNKEKLMNQLQTRIRDGFVRGDNFESLTKVMTERLGVGYNDARRLIWTESSYIMNQASAQPYIDAGERLYRINAVLDNKTSRICRSLHGDVFKFEDRKVGINFPPFHPYCRTMIVGVKNPRTLDDIKKEEPINKFKTFTDHEDINAYWSEKKGYNEWRRSITQEEKSSLRLYTSSDYTPMNITLRNGKSYFETETKYANQPRSFYEEIYKQIDDVKNSISQYKLEDSIKVFRGIGGWIKGLEEDETFIVDKGFMSTSLLKEKTESFMKATHNTFFEIEVPKGSNSGAFIAKESKYSNEQEFLILPDTKFIVKEIETDSNNTQIVRMEVVPND